MRIGILAAEPSPTTGGEYTFVIDALAAILRQANQWERHELLILRTGTEFAERSLEDNVREVTMPKPHRDRPSASVLGKIARRLLKPTRGPSPLRVACERYSVDFLWYLSNRYFPKYMDVPFMAIVWDLQHRLQPFFPEVSSDGIWRSREKSYAEFLRRATYVIVGTEAGRGELHQFYQVADARILKLPHPTPSDALAHERASAPEVLTRHEIRPGYLFYPAQFWPHKNHITVLEALRILHDEGRPLDVVFTGTDMGNESWVRSRVEQLRLGRHVHFLGFVARAELLSLYEHASALIYASHFGPENLPPLEAFAVGCPVVAARVPGSEEQLGEAAILFDPSRERELADAVKRLMGSPELVADLRDAGSKRAREFTFDDFAHQGLRAIDRFGRIRRNWS